VDHPSVSVSEETLVVLVTTAVADPFDLAADLIDPPMKGAALYHDRPRGFIEECFIWEKDKEPTEYQLEVADLIIVEHRVSVCGPHGLGKTAFASWIVLWFALTRDAMNEDWKVPTTASVWRQLEKFLWPEIHKWAKRLDWEKLERRPFIEGDELLDMALKLRTGEAFAVASDDPAKIEGAHADQLLYIYDESKAIIDKTFDASEGAFSGAGEDTASEAFALASSTPGEPNGRFYDIQKHKPGTEDWATRAVSKEEVIKAGRMSKKWATQRKKQWGEESAVYQNRVEGKFASSEEDTVIPLSWIEASNERWLALFDDDGDLLDPVRPIDNIGADVARSGKDKTVLALRSGAVLLELRRYTRQGTMDTQGRIEGVQRGTDAWATIDVIGIGAGVVDRNIERGLPTVAFNASRKTEVLDMSGELEFVNCRAASWWNLRELLDPDASTEAIALPPDDMLTGDLTAPHWKVMSGGRIQVESKDDIVKRLGRSTDDGDAVVMAFWEGQLEDMEWVEEEDDEDRVEIGVDL
jgi:hypothetical protein